MVLSNDGAYLGFCIISQVRVWYRKRSRLKSQQQSSLSHELREAQAGREVELYVINQRQKVLLSEGASAHLTTTETTLQHA